jgi:hypothetical protein
MCQEVRTHRPAGKRRGRDSLRAYLLPIPDCSNCWNSSRFGHLVNERSGPLTPDWRYPTPQNGHKEYRGRIPGRASSKSARTQSFACPIALAKMSGWPRSSPIRRSFILAGGRWRSFGAPPKRSYPYSRAILHNNLPERPNAVREALLHPATNSDPDSTATRSPRK